MNYQLKGYKRPEVSGVLNGKYKHGMTNHPSFRLWHLMMSRCYTPTNRMYASYGGRGIGVCERWHEFKNFYADMGDRPHRMSLDRVDNDGNYEPSNCRWATQRQQQRNRTNNVTVDFRGKAILLCELVEQQPISYNAVQGRVYRKKISHQEAVNQIVYEKGL